jgi:hypothetical protein
MKANLAVNIFSVGAMFFALAGCASPSFIEHKWSNGDTTRLVKTGVGLAGGPMLVDVQTVKASTNEVDAGTQVSSSSTGTFQETTGGLFTSTATALINGHYQAEYARKLRPDNTNIDVSSSGGVVGDGAVNVDNSNQTGDVTATGNGGEGGQGGTVASGAIKNDVKGGTSAVASGAVKVEAQGGSASSISKADPIAFGGEGGQGGKGGTGGNSVATASPKLDNSSSSDARAESDNTAAAPPIKYKASHY